MKKKVLLFVICMPSLLGGCKKYVNNSKIILPETVGVLEECEKQQEGRPEIVLSGESILEVKINNQESYKTFIKQIEEYKDCAILYIDLLGSNTIVYLDEILSQSNFVIVEISNGGVLSAKDMEVCKETNLRDLQLKYMFRIDNCVLDLFDSLETVLLWTDQSFEGQEFGLFHGEEWNRLMSISPEDKRDYGAVYILNEEGIIEDMNGDGSKDVEVVTYFGDPKSYRFEWYFYQGENGFFGLDRAEFYDSEEQEPYCIQLPKKSEKETTGVVQKSEETVAVSQQMEETQKREKIDDVEKEEMTSPQFDHQTLNKDLFGQNTPHGFEIQLFSESVKGEFVEVQKENSMFPEELISEFENMIYQSFDGSLQKYAWEEVQKSSYFEITDKFGASDFRPDIEGMRKLFPELEDTETRMEAYKKLCGSENCIDMFHFHMDTNQDNYLFEVHSGGSAGIVNIWLTRLEQGEFVTICEFPVENSGYGRVIKYDEDFYYVFAARNYNIKNFDGIHIHKLGVNAREENLVIKYLPTEYVWKNVYMRADGEELDTYLESIKDEITSDKYLENGKEKDIEVYYGDEASFVPDNDKGLYFDGYNTIDFLNIGNPVYIKKSNRTPYGDNSANSMWYLKCDFKIQNIVTGSLIKLDNMEIGEYMPLDFDPIMVQMWFKESEDKVYTFCLYHVCDYNYVLNVLLIEGDKVSRIRTDIISPRRQFVLTEGEIFNNL